MARIWRDIDEIEIDEREFSDFSFLESFIGKTGLDKMRELFSKIQLKGKLSYMISLKNFIFNTAFSINSFSNDKVVVASSSIGRHIIQKARQSAISLKRVSLIKINSNYNH